MPRKYVILDRDGTVVEEKHHLSDPAGLELLPGAGEALSRIARMGLGLLVVTNQSPVGRGLLSLETLDRIHVRLRHLLNEFGVSFSGIYCCPHTPDDHCECRKPRTGLVDRAARELGFNPGDCYLVGDNVSDIALGNRVGATTFLVRTGYGASMESKVGTMADYIVDDLSAAAKVIEGLESRPQRESFLNELVKGSSGRKV